MPKSSLTALVVAGFAFAGICGLSAAAHASLTWDWTWSGTDTGMGTLTTTDLQSNGSYEVTVMTGLFDGEAITGTNGTQAALNAFLNDNLLLAGTPQLDVGGLAFSTANDVFDFFHDPVKGYQVDNIEFTLEDLGTFNATLAVPEPASATVLATALVGLGLLRRRRRRGA